MKMHRKARLGEKILIEAEVLSERTSAEGDDLTVDYYKVRVPGHAKPIAVMADAVREPVKQHFYETEVDYDESRAHFSQLLRNYRQANNLSQFDLAEGLGVSQNSISQWEQGLYMPRFDKVIVLVNYLGIPVEEVFDTSSTLST